MITSYYEIFLLKKGNHKNTNEDGQISQQRLPRSCRQQCSPPPPRPRGSGRNENIKYSVLRKMSFMFVYLLFYYLITIPGFYNIIIVCIIGWHFRNYWYIVKALIQNIQIFFFLSCINNPFVTVFFCNDVAQFMQGQDYIEKSFQKNKNE